MKSSVRFPRLWPLRLPSRRTVKKGLKRIVPLAAALYLVPYLTAVAFAVGFIDYARNTGRGLASFDRYFFGNGIVTWLLAPFNLLMDLLTFPYRNRGVYNLADLPRAYQDELTAIFDAAHRNDLVGKLREKLGDTKRAMIFFKWYGKNVQTTVDIPEFHHKYKYIKTIGVSVFSKKQSTGKHFGPLRITLRLLYNINQINSDQVFIKVGTHANYWRENKLFIFDDTLQHQSCNQSDEVRYCMFVDILRPSLVPWLMGGILACVRTVIARFNAMFYKNWAVIK